MFDWYWALNDWLEEPISFWFVCVIAGYIVYLCLKLDQRCRRLEERLEDSNQRLFERCEGLKHEISNLEHVKLANIKIMLGKVGQNTTPHKPKDES